MCKQSLVCIIDLRPFFASNCLASYYYYYYYCHFINLLLLSHYEMAFLTYLLKVKFDVF